MIRNYNTFAVCDCKSRKPILITSSARKAYSLLEVGKRVDVWNKNTKVETIYGHGQYKKRLLPYIELEKAYIKERQERATARNAQRRKPAE